MTSRAGVSCGALSRRDLRALALVPALLLLQACCTFAAPGYQGPADRHFDGQQFQNPVAIADKGFADFVQWRQQSRPGTWKHVDVPQLPRPMDPPPVRVGPGDMRVTFINHTTVLIQIDGLNLLTDPVWSNRVGPRPWLGVARQRPPGLPIEALPPIDAVLLSHNHYDHLDIPTLQTLWQRHRMPIIAGRGTRALLAKHDLASGVDLDWGETWNGEAMKKAGLAIHFTPAQHFANRGLCDRNNTQWGAFAITSPHGTVYFGGDTGWGPHFEEARQKFAPIRLALLPIGAFRPGWFMSPVHISPEQAVQAHEALGAKTSVATHFGTFPLADDGEWDPHVFLDIALARRLPATHRFWVLEAGEGRDIPAL